MNLEKKNIALIAGGDSGEYEVSLNSAKAISKNLDQAKYNVFFIHMRGLDWHYIDHDNNKYEIDKNDFSIQVDNDKIFFDVAFIIIHGTPGEDGKLQSYLEMLNIPFTTCDSYTAATTFKKDFTKYIAHDIGVHVAKTICIRLNEPIKVKELINEVKLPCFVKPNKGGSSVGISKVDSENDFLQAVHIAFKEDDEVLIEEALKGIEIGCGVYKINGKISALSLTEIVSKTSFFDYVAKYHNASDEITPARIPDSKTNECQKLSIFLYEKFNCKGLVRFDYILQDDILYFLEVNTVPGLSEASIVPQQLRHAGIKEGDLYSQLIEEALNTHK